jgi:hypothetical protein
MVEDNQNVEEEIQHEEVVQSQEENNHTPTESTYQKEMSDKDRNFNRLRESKEQLEREVRELKQAMEQSAQKQQIQPQDEDNDINDDDLVEGKEVKKLRSQIRSLSKAMEQTKLSAEEMRLKSKFNDFDQVVNRENLEKLKTTEPELYASITSGPDLYAKGVSAYKTLKALGFVNEENYSAQKEQVKENHGRPVSAQAIRGQGVLSEANIFAKGLTPELKKQLQSEMSQAIKAR